VKSCVEARDLWRIRPQRALQCQIVRLMHQSIEFRREPSVLQALGWHCA
jgi:hypothetical protein